MMLCTNKERERVRETMDQTQTQRYVSRFEPLALRHHLHREGFLIHYTPTEGTSTEEDLIQHKEYRTPLSNTASQPRGRPVAKQQPTNISTEEGIQTKLHLSLEGANHNLNLYQIGSKPITRSPLPKRDTTKIRVYNLEATTTSNNLFSHKQMILNRLG